MHNNNVPACLRREKFFLLINVGHKQTTNDD
jgi:hypothetical protein